MHRLRCLTLLLLASPLTAPALMFRGSLTQTVTETNDPDYYVGQILNGYYAYSAPTIDGTFVTDTYPGYWPPGTNTSLEGSLYLTFSDEVFVYPGGGGFDLDWGPGGGFTDFSNTMNHGELTVSGGLVTDFVWSLDHGGFFMWVTESAFVSYSYYDTWIAPDHPVTRGTVVLGRPYEVSEAFPVAAHLLMAGLLGGMGAARRRRGRQPASAR